MWLALRAVFWAALFPGTFGFYVPWRFFGLSQVRIDTSNVVHLAGLAFMAAGSALLGTCIWEFARRGRGTLSPADPPEHLVVDGLYRFVRNPMYLSVTAIIAGEILLTRSRGLALYWVIWFTAVNLFVLGYEEPFLRARFPAAYAEYARAVPRWLPRLTPWRSTPPSNS